MRLSKQTSDAIKILVILAHADGQLLKVADVAAEVPVPKPLGLKLVNLLARLEYVETVRGPRGGIRLATPACDMTIGRLVRDLEAMQAQHENGEDSDSFERFVDNAFDAFLAVLDQHTIADMAAGASVNTSMSGSESASVSDASASASASVSAGGGARFDEAYGGSPTAGQKPPGNTRQGGPTGARAKAGKPTVRP